MIKFLFGLLLGVFISLFFMLWAIECDASDDLETHARVMEQKYDLPPNLLVSICYIESHWRNGEVGKHGEIGVCQIKPSTAQGVLGVSNVLQASQRPVLALGSRGVLVIDLQKRVVSRKYPALPLGEFDEYTKEAVLDYQRDHHLIVDGIVGPQTWASLLGKPPLIELLWNPKTNIEIAAIYLSDLSTKHKLKEPVALACLYNGGEAASWCRLEYMKLVAAELTRRNNLKLVEIEEDYYE